jgi:ABC-type multidrug transport system fused ATPase/permease subunit
MLVLLGFLDLFGVALVGLVVSISLDGLFSTNSDSFSLRILDTVGINDLGFETKIIILSSATLLVFIFKTLFALLLNYKSTHFLSSRAAKKSGDVIAKLFSGDLNTVGLKKSQDALFSVTGGINLVYLGILGTIANMFADIFLLILLAGGLFLLEPIIFLISSVVFFAVAYFTYSLTIGKIRNLSREETKIAIKSNERILNGMLAFREVVTKGLEGNLVRDITHERHALSSITANLNFLPTIGKYTIEITTIVGVILVAIVQLSQSTVLGSVAILSVYLAASSRIAPAALRLQQGFSSLKRSYGSAESAIQYFDYLQTIEVRPLKIVNFKLDHHGFTPKVVFDRVSFMYEGSRDPVLKNVSFAVEPGEFIGIIGPTGAGKSSLLDVLLGLQSPTSGTVTISHTTPTSCIECWPGAIGYVPQNMYLHGGTIRDYLCLGLHTDSIAEDRIQEVLRIASIFETIKALPLGVDSELGENGGNLSGGQRQRLGIARALLSNPSLILLDESTSSLDTQTELDISRALRDLKRSHTIIAVAHRISTLENADRIIFLNNGEIQSEGNLADIKNAQPWFFE